MEFVWGRYSGLFYTGAGSLLFVGIGILFGSFWLLLAVGFFFLFLIGLSDYLQKKRSVLGNFPLMGRFRFIFEAIRPELRQYLWEADSDELPYSRNQRAMVYQRSKQILAARPFGSDENQYLEDFNWLNHPILPTKIEDDDFRITVGEENHRYNISILNISGTSFGSISPKAIQSFSAGAKKGGFAHNTGEGSLSKYHEQGGGDTIWQISTGYFGCRNQDGTFDEVQFAEKAKLPQVKMIEIKLSQGAKLGHGGMLLGAKVSPEIAELAMSQLIRI